MQEVFNQGWYSGNESVKYPLHPDASGITDKGDELPSELISDIRLISTRQDTFYISGVTCSEHLFSIVIASSRGIEAAATIPQPIKPLTHYPLETFHNDLSGVIAVGHPYTHGQWQFSTPEQGKLDPSAAIIMAPWPVTSIGCRDMLKDEVWFVDGNDIQISVEDMIVSETRKPENTKKVKAIVFKLVEFSENNEEGVRSKYLSPCAVRPDNGECDYITSLGGATPDCDGNIEIKFTTDNYMQELFEPNSENTDCGPILKPIETHVVERPISYGRCGDDLCSTEDNEAAEQAEEPDIYEQLKPIPYVNLSYDVYPVDGYAMFCFEGKIEAPPDEEAFVTCDQEGTKITATFRRNGACGIAWDIEGRFRKFIYDGQTLTMDNKSIEVGTATARITMSITLDETNSTVTGTLTGIPADYENHYVQELASLTATDTKLGKPALYLKDTTCTEWAIE